MRIDVEHQENGLLLRLAGRFDAHETASFRKAAESERAKVPGDIRLDLANVIFIDSSALAELVTLYRALEAENCSLTIVEISDPVRIILELTKLDQVFAVSAAGPVAQDS